MRTEEEIISTIHLIVRAGEVNLDDPINERLLRSFLQIHRARNLEKKYEKGMQLPDEVFQDLSPLRFSFINGIYEAAAPSTISLSNFGFKINIDDFPLSVVNDEEFRNSMTDTFNKYSPKIKIIGRKLYLYAGNEQSCHLDDVSNSPMNRAIRKIKQSAITSTLLDVDFKAVLVNPDDEPGYDFTKHAYPMPNEDIEDLLNSINAREFNFFLRMKSDETGDSRDNTSEFQTREEI
jgi:hypothetical protein